MMMQYQSYNPKSPLDPVAARWAEQNPQLLPVGHENLYQPELDIDLLGGGGADEPAPSLEEDMDIKLF